MTLSGTVNSTNGTYLLPGTVVTVTVDGNSQQTVINDSTGDFSIKYNASSIPARVTPYPITYASASAGHVAVRDQHNDDAGDYSIATALEWIPGGQ